MIIGDQWLYFFLAIAIALGLQLVFSSRQAVAFTREVHALRRLGRVAVGMGGATWFGRRVFVAVAVRPDDTVAAAIRLRGITQFARARPAPAYLDLDLAVLAGQADLPWCSRAERDAARQAARTLRGDQRAADGMPAADGATRGKEESAA